MAIGRFSVTVKEFKSRCSILSTLKSGLVRYGVSYSRETVKTWIANGHGIHNYAPFDQWLCNFHFKLTLK